MTKFILGIGISVACAILPASAQYTAIVNPAVQNQTLEGWGTSLSWFANGVGSWPEPVRSNLIDSLFAAPPDGLGLTYARYNIGEVLSVLNRSGNRPSHEGAAEEVN